jgi:sec-independent protein translocase protein TatB
MLDIGLGEVIVIAILALLVFGPDRLPKVASDAARTLRQVRQMATAARKDLSDAAGLQDDDELVQAVREIRELDPRRALRGLGDDPAPSTGAGRSAAGPSSTGRAAGGPATRSTAAGAGAPSAAGSGDGGGGAAGGAAAAGGPAAARPAAGTDAPAGTGSGPEQADPGQPAAGPVLDASPVDPDWT